MSRFFIPKECIKGNIALVVGQEAHHILDVMRLKRGDKIITFDGTGKLYQGRILDTARRLVKLQIEAIAQDLSRSNFKITLIQALPKMNKMDYIVEKSTELGVDIIIPTQTARTIVRLDRQRQVARNMRWQRIATQAAKQCGRVTVPQLKDLTPWSDILPLLNNYDLKLLACLSAKAERIKDILRAQNQFKEIALFIGPEGDFTPDEIRQACNSGCVAISLGKTVLKTDTAALSALAMINYELN